MRRDPDLEQVSPCGARPKTRPVRDCQRALVCIPDVARCADSRSRKLVARSLDAQQIVASVINPSLGPARLETRAIAEDPIGRNGPLCAVVERALDKGRTGGRVPFSARKRSGWEDEPVLIRRHRTLPARPLRGSFQDAYRPPAWPLPLLLLLSGRRRARAYSRGARRQSRKVLARSRSTANKRGLAARRAGAR